MDFDQQQTRLRNKQHSNAKKRSKAKRGEITCDPSAVKFCRMPEKAWEAMTLAKDLHKIEEKEESPSRGIGTKGPARSRRRGSKESVE